MIHTSQGVRKVVRISQGNSHRTDLDRNAVDVNVPDVVVSVDLAVNLGQELQCIQDCLATLSRLSCIQRYIGESGIASWSWDVGTRRVSGVGRLSPAVDLEQPKEEGTVFLDGPADTASPRVVDKARRPGKAGSFVEQAYGFHPIGAVEIGRASCREW